MSKIISSIMFLLLLGCFITLITINSIYMQQLRDDIYSLQGNYEYLTNSLEVKRDINNYGVGNNGIFSPSTQNILIDTTKRENYDVCLTFFHELGHKIHFNDYNDYINSTTAEKEMFAEEYAEQNSWRCKGV